MRFRQFLIVTFWVLTSIAYAQEAPTFPLHVEGTITNLEDTPMSGAIIQVSQNGQVIKNITTDGSGSYQFDLPLNSDYVVTVTKPGHVSKKFTVSTKGVPPDRATSKFGTVEASLSLFEKMEGIDYSPLNQPMNKYSYNANKENFEYDANYLNAMIASLQNIMAQQAAAIERAKQLERNYQAAIKAGDKAFQKNDWAGAKAAYTQALGLKPNETWPKDQMTQIDKIIKEQEALNKKKEEDAKKAADEAAKAKAEAELNAKYAAAIKKGDDAFNAKNWAAAKLGYNEAIGYKPGEQYPKDKLAAIDKAIADEAANKSKAELDAKYAAAVKKGDDAFNAKNWTAAKAGYNEALGFKPAEQYPKDKIAAIDKAIADEAAAKSKADAEAKNKAELEAKYAAAIKRGDEGFAKKDWANAKAAYTEASGLKSAEQYPKTQLAAIDKAIADEAALKAKADADAKAKAELEAKYAAAIKKGDDAFAKKDWATAKGGYNEALTIKANEQYPKDKLAAIDKAIADENAAKSKAELDAKYAAAIKKGDDAFGKKDWLTAKGGYNEALTIKANEQYPKDKLAAIDKALADEEAAKAKAEADAKSKAELEAKYAAAIKKGDEGFSKKDWANAKSAYNEALGYKSAEKYPKDQIAAIDKALADEAAAKAKADADKAKAEADAKAKAELEAKYAAAIKKADEAFAAKSWPAARTGYNEALGFKPNEAYPKSQLAAIDKAIADEKANMDAAAKAKAEAELNAKYEEAIKQGDAGFANKDWVNAKAAYNKALGFKPSEKYPKDQIAAIDKTLADEAAAKAKADADAKSKAEKEAKYAAAIKKGDDGFNAKNWTNAKAGYNEALGIKPDEQYPKDRLAAIDKAIADENANKSKAELDAKYNAAIKKGDDAFAKKDWTTAKGGYNEALNVKANEQYPKDRLVAIDKAIADESANKSKAELEAKYAAAIKKGDDAFAKKDWTTAKGGYNEALNVKANEQYPKDKLAEIEKAITSENANKSKAELDAKYQAAIKKGDAAFAKKDWTTAKAGYNEALGVKADEQYPKDKLAEIEKAIGDELANKSKAEGDAKAKAEKDAKYAAAIKKGDDAFTKKEWVSAKEGYIEASGLKPEEQYPKVRLAAIEAEISKEGEAKALAELKAKYDAIIKKADGLFARKAWVEAKAAYYEALQYLPDEKYPKMQIGAINKAMSGANDPNEQKYKDAIAKADNNFNGKQYKEAKTHYEEALTYKGGDAYAKGRLLEVEKLLNSDNQVKAADRKKELLAKYPPGVTEEIINGQGVTIIQRIVVKNGDVWVYQKKVFTWGGISYFRDGSPITELIFENETKP